MEEEKPPLKRTKRLTSAVWNDFDRVRKGDMMVAICKHCDKKLSGSSTSGTSHLRNHLKRCLKRSDEDIAQQRLVVREKKGTVDLKSIKLEEDEHSRFRSRFDQNQSQDDLTRMIILHGYPLAMVEHIGFRRFVSNLQPLFQIMSSDSARASCVELYEKEKQKVYDALLKLPGRISLTAEVWTSYQETRSLCLTAYYIDEAWQLQRKMLNFVYVESDTEQAFSEALMACLMKWGIDRKLFSITVDNCSNNDIAIFKVRDRLSEEKSILSNVKLFHVRCATRILNVIVEDVLEALQDVTHKIRESIRYVCSESVKEKFSEVSQQVSEKTLSVDIPDQWTSTYEMLESAIEYREAFTRLQASDTSYLTSPSDIEWERTISLTNYLKLVVEVTNVISGAKYPTANIYFPEICDIHLKLIEWCKSSDTCISSMALKMKEKFDSYWSVSGLSLTLAVVLDPRFKMKVVEYYFKQMFEDTAPDSIKEISVAIEELFHEYSTPPSSGDNKTLTGNENSSVLESETNDRLSGFDKFLHDTSSSPHMKSELDKYLEEPIFPRNADFDILNWWKVSSPKYPVLSVMARDILGSSMSIADSMASAFVVGGRVLDLQRTSLSPDILEALVCTHDWLRTEFESELVVTDSIRPLTITAN